VIHAKSKAWKEVLKYADRALLTDHNYSKALYHKGRALIELTEYAKAIETLKQAATVDSGNSEILKKISRAE
jgi:tetratricopeptide (TPR) repeat protein